MTQNKKKSKLLTKANIKIISLFLILAVSVTGVGIVYSFESQETYRGSADFQLSYQFYLKNEGPIDLNTVSLRLALLKDWAPVQNVSSLVLSVPPNETTTDEYENEFAWYYYNNFKSNQSITLQFHANMSLHFVDYSTVNIENLPYDTESDNYKLFTAYHPLADTSDPNIRRVAQSLYVENNPVETAFNAYNFSATYLRYRLLSSIRGATYALQNADGDCDEYTTLFLALVRSVGIPAVGHTAWLADFAPGFISTDEGGVAHAYPMYFVEGVGMLPVDPTRGKSSIFDNWVKTDHKRITLTRGPDNPYRLLRYTWTPIEGLPSPNVVSNYTISIQNMDLHYTSQLRQIILIGLPSLPVIFLIVSIIRGFGIRKSNKLKLEKILSPELNQK